MDDWPKAIFLAADGARTIEEFLAYACDGMTSVDAAQVREVVPAMLQELVNAGLIELSATPGSLPFYLERSMTEYDRKEAAAAMARDGFIKT
ncbi:MAG: hypothetical protein SFX73_34745 [Kofleriaceae bacterium]|nr:hypothetical protein [Kofleriaceae bacterium]